MFSLFKNDAKFYLKNNEKKPRNDSSFYKAY